MTDKKRKTRVETILDEAGTAHLEKGEENPLKAEGLQEEDLRLFYDADGNLECIGGVDDDFRIQHDTTHLVEDVDSVDLGFLKEALSSKTIKKWLRELEKQTRFYKEAFENIFLLLVKAKPALTSKPSPSQLYLLRLLDEILTQEEFEALAKKCTLNVSRATLVAKSWVEAISKILDDEDLQFIEDMEHLDIQFRGVLGDLDDFIKRSACGQAIEGQTDAMGMSMDPDDHTAPCPGCGKAHVRLRPPTPKEMGLTAEDARKRLRELTQEFSKLRKKINEKIEANKERLEAIAKRIADEGMAKGQTSMEHLDSLTTTSGTSEGELKQIDMEKILEISERYRTDKMMKELIDNLGRMRRIALKTMRSMTREVDNANNKPVELSDDISKLMPSEMVRTRHPQLRRDFKKRLLEKNLECFDRKGKTPTNRGPIIVCKDTSGSMSGSPNAWASALYLTTGFIAAAQNRRSVLVNFASPGQLKVDEFDRSTPFVDYIDVASYMFNGGTCFETPLGKCLELIQESAYNKADVLFLTDGICHVSDEFLKNFLKVKAEKEFNVITVLINIAYGDYDVVNSFSDKVFCLSDLQSDDDVLSTAFAL